MDQSIKWGPIVVSVIVSLGFIGMIFALLFGKIDPSVASVLLLLTGALAASFGQVVSYWMGSTKSTDTMAARR